jgi:NAD(P)-dependent dehydrogenase (short-subunit alcohol dehydrogenase family)
MNAFTNKVAVITGGNSGIGLATAKELSRRGANAIISGRDEKTLAEAVASIGRDTLAVRAGVSRLSDLDERFARTRERFGSFDVLFVNARIAKFAPVEQTTEALHDEILDSNFKGVFFTVQKALPLLKDGGTIVLNTAVADQKWIPTTSVYAVSKAVLRSLTRTLAAELLERHKNCSFSVQSNGTTQAVVRVKGTRTLIGEIERVSNDYNGTEFLSRTTP